MKRSRKFWALAIAGVMSASLVLAGCGSKPADSGTTGNNDTSGQTTNTAPTLGHLKMELMTYTNPRPYNPEGDKLAEAIQSELAKIGVDVKVTALPWAEHKTAVLKEGKGDAYMFGWIGDNGDADNFLYVHFHSSQWDALNSGKYKNDQVDKLLADAAATSDQATRSKLYIDAQKLIMQDAPWVVFNHTTDFAVLRAGVSGYQLHPTGQVDLRDVVTGKDTLIYARGADATSLDPAMVEDGESAKVIQQIHDNLVRYKPGSTEVEPSLAKSWETSADGLTWTFHLRDDVKFSDGTPFTSADVAYSIGRQMKGKATSDMPYADFSFGMIKEIKTPDDHTVQFVLEKPYAPFVANLAMSLAAPIIQKKQGEAKGAGYGEAPIGTGPFMLKEWKKNQQIVLEANPYYWDKNHMPKVKTVIFTVTDKNTVRVDQILTGQADIADGVSTADVPRIEAAKDKATLLRAPGMNINYMAFRIDHKPFDNPEIRKAISMAINREAIVKSLYHGYAELAKGPMPGFIPGADPNGQPYPYNPDEAKAILAKLGYDTTPIQK
jgi:ABC-type transport system substrate-binding protein